MEKIMKKIKENKIILIIISIVIVLIGGITIVLSRDKTKEYEVIFDTKGGTTVSSKKVLEGEKIQKPKDPKKEGYLFLEWILDGKTFNFNQEITKDIKLEAKWYKLEKGTTYYTVTFNSEGGTTISNQTIEEGNIATKPNDPQKEGYTFKYWELNNEEYNFDTEVTKDIELTAKYEKNTNPTQKVEEEIKVEVPTLTNVSGTKENRVMYANLNIVTEGKYASGRLGIKGYELYEKNGNNYTKIGENETLKDIKVTVDIGENKTYVARAYKLNKSNKKVYSAYSNEIKIDNSKIDTPTLTNVSGTRENEIMYSNLNIFSEGIYASGTLKISGYEVYEKNGSNYTKIGESETLKDIKVAVEKGEIQTYVARAYVYNKSNKKVYSDYSNEIKVDNSKIDAPTLTNASGSKENGIMHAKLGILVEGLYASGKLKITGFELYEKKGNNYTKVEDSANLKDIEVTVNPGETKIYVAKAYLINKSGKKVYSEYSNEVKIIN